METAQVLEEMFGAYKSISLDKVAKERVEKNVCIEGNLIEYLLDKDGFFMDFGFEEEEVVTLKYVPQIGISVKRMEKLCEIIKKYNPKLKIYGKIVHEGEESTFREIEVHAIEFETNGKKVRYPNAEMIEGDKKPMPYIGMDGIDQQMVEKEFHKIHNSLDTLDILNMLEGELTQNEKKEKIDKLLKRFDKPKTEMGRTIADFLRKYQDDIINYALCQIFKDTLQRAEAEFEFYKVFEDARFKAEQKLREDAPKVQILEGEIKEDAKLGL